MTDARTAAQANAALNGSDLDSITAGAARGGFSPRVASTVKVEPFEWAWSNRLLLRYLNLLVGDEGTGKGTLLAWVIARLTRGDLPGDLQGEPARVLLIGDEDGFGGVWKPRLMAAGADLELVSDLPPAERGQLNVQRDIEALAAIVAEHDFRVVIFDQLLDNLPSGCDPWRDGDVRSATAPLRRLVQEKRLCAVCTLHTNKSDGGTFRKKMAGSYAFNAIARSAFLLAQHPEQEDRRVVVRGKGNFGPRPPAFEFSIEERPLEIEGFMHRPTAATNIAESDLRIEALLAPATATTHTKAAEARAIIRDALADGEWHPATPILQELKEEGLAYTTAKRAQNELGIERRKTSEFQPATEWRLPNLDAELERIQAKWAGGSS